MALQQIRSEEELRDAIVAADAYVRNKDRLGLGRHMLGIVQAPADLQRAHHDAISKLVDFLMLEAST